jgi:putative hydrolase of the HAD superfamily
MKVRAILFDLGGVLLNLDYRRTINAFQELGISDFEKVYAQAAQSALFDDFETGKISTETFQNGIRNISGLSLSDDTIQHAWNAMLLDFPEERIHLLESLKKDYQILLFSNTNAIHLKAFRAIIARQHGDPTLLESIFDRVFYSHIEGVRKPNPSAFQQILNKENLHPKEVVFIDDSLQHVEGARQIGMEAHHLEGQDVITLIKSLRLNER